MNNDCATFPRMNRFPENFITIAEWFGGKLEMTLSNQNKEMFGSSRLNRNCQRCLGR